MKQTLLFFLIATSFRFAEASCDRFESSFEKSVASLIRNAPGKALVILGEVIEAKYVYPYSKPAEMKIEVLSVIRGKWEEKVLTAKRGDKSGNSYFEKYIPGKRYLLAFTRELDRDDSIYFSQSICGTYSKLLE